jgi:hypothetical protein
LLGSGPVAVSTFSSMCFGSLVSVSTDVSDSFARMYFSENCAHVSQPKSRAQSGSA